MTDGAAVDEIGRSVRELADDLEQRLDEAAVVERDDVFLGAVHLRPVRSGAQAVGWIDLGEELQVYTGTCGRWELDRATEDIAFIRDVCEAVIAGRRHEAHALRRSRVVLRLADGKTEHTTVSEGCLLAFVPLPFRTRWGKRTQFDRTNPTTLPRPEPAPRTG